MPDRAIVTKFIRDPIHDIIRIEHRFALELLDSPAMQRLRRIRQLGVAWMVYPGAEHSRFTHALGVFHLAERVMSQLDHDAKRGWFDNGRREAVLAAALLHDVGHGPFSHVFEHVGREIHKTLAVSHEDWTKRIVKDDKRISAALVSVSAELPDQVCQILDHTFKPHFVTAIISSQLDVDRFDYLLRDSHMTGARYGAFDLEWMLRTLAIHEVRPASADGSTERLETIVVDGQRGLSGLEDHLIGRHYMYRHVYYHKTIRSAEQMLRSILKRAAELVQGGRKLGNAAFQKMARGEALDVAEYLSLDDFVLMGWIEDWARSVRDKVLRDMCDRLLNRRLFKAIIVPEEPKDPSASLFGLWADNKERLRKLARRHQFNPDYYVLEDEVKDIAYKGYLYNLGRSKVADEEEIWYLDRGGTPQRLSGCNSILVEAPRALQYKEDRWFVPEEVASDAQTVLAW